MQLIFTLCTVESWMILSIEVNNVWVERIEEEEGYFLCSCSWLVRCASTLRDASRRLKAQFACAKTVSEAASVISLLWYCALFFTGQIRLQDHEQTCLLELKKSASLIWKSTSEMEYFEIQIKLDGYCFKNPAFVNKNLDVVNRYLYNQMKIC